ncbi:MAG: hypothetical protein ACTSVB_07930 [Candidatus Heimdallarchaeaceae archaeon]
MIGTLIFGLICLLAGLWLNDINSKVKAFQQKKLDDLVENSIDYSKIKMV